MKATWNHRVEYVLLRALTALVGPLGIQRAGAIGAHVAKLGYWPLRIRRAVVTRHINACFPERSDAERRALVRESYAHLGRVMLDSVVLSRTGSDAIHELFERVDGWEIIERHRARGEGIVLVAGHLGNWELSGAYLAALGLKVAAVAKRQFNPLVDGFANRTRRRLGITVVYDDEAVRRIPRLLREGYGVGLLSDQSGLGAATHVNFFGRPARTPRGAAVFALRFHAPLIFVLAARQPNGKYVLHLEEVEVVRTGNLDADVDATTARFTAVLERWVRRYPGQYLWAHRRWKRQPDNTPPELREP